jgi:tRNA wybutosine-synthesizing protein 4
MRTNLAQRSSPLLGITSFPDAAAHRQRYLKHGYDKSEAIDLQTYLSTEELFPFSEFERVSKLELFDEYEEWLIKCSHYCLVWGSTSKTKGRLWTLKDPTLSNPKPVSTSEPQQPQGPLYSHWEKFKTKELYAVNRWGHTSCTLPDGKIWVWGGFGIDSKGSHVRLTDAVILDPFTMTTQVFFFFFTFYNYRLWT